MLNSVGGDWRGRGDRCGRVCVSGEIIQSSGGPRHLFTIPLKDYHLFKIAELEFVFKHKLVTDSAILNRWESFSGMVDHVTYSP